MRLVVARRQHVPMYRVETERAVCFSTPIVVLVLILRFLASPWAAVSCSSYLLLSPDCQCGISTGTGVTSLRIVGEAVLGPNWDLKDHRALSGVGLRA